MSDDPFAPENDPALVPTRRTALKLLVALPAAASMVAGCAGRRLACVVPGQAREGTCEHRFCRYHRG